MSKVSKKEKVETVWSIGCTKQEWIDESCLDWENFCPLISVSDLRKQLSSVWDICIQPLIDAGKLVYKSDA